MLGVKTIAIVFVTLVSCSVALGGGKMDSVFGLKFGKVYTKDDLHKFQGDFGLLEDSCFNESEIHRMNGNRDVLACFLRTVPIPTSEFDSFGVYVTPQEKRLVAVMANTKKTTFVECERVFARVVDAVKRGLEISFEEEGDWFMNSLGQASAGWNYSELGPSMTFSCVADSSLYHFVASFWNYRELPAH